MKQIKLPFKSTEERVVDEAIRLSLEKGRNLDSIPRERLIKWVRNSHKIGYTLGVDFNGVFYTKKL